MSEEHVFSYRKAGPASWVVACNGRDEGRITRRGAKFMVLRYGTTLAYENATLEEALAFCRKLCAMGAL